MRRRREGADGGEGATLISNGGDGGGACAQVISCPHS
tara:strand:- start:244 stop:354 length:111 start_codon:yes stop_codon:yes gene_type:complete